MDKIKLLQFHNTFLLEKKSIKKEKIVNSSKCFVYDSSIELEKQKVKSNFIDLDVSSSGFQIMGLLCGDLKILRLTNFLKSSKKKRDFYNNFIIQYSKFILENLNNFKFSFMEKKIVVKIIEFTFTRKLLKKIIMAFLYGQEIKNLTLSFFKNFTQVKKIISQLRFEFYSYSNFQKKLKFSSIVFFVCKNLSKLLNIFFEKKYSNFFSIKNIIQKLALSKKVQDEGLFLNLGKDRSLVNYKCKKKIRIKKNILKKTICTIKQSTVFDKSSAKRRSMPNFIHRIDAELCAIVCENFGYKNQSIISLHDCFNIFLNNKEDVKTSYFNACVSLILNPKSDILFDFIKINSDTFFLEENKSLIKKLKKKRFLIFKKIKKNKLFMSSFILS